MRSGKPKLHPWTCPSAIVATDEPHLREICLFALQLIASSVEILIDCTQLWFFFVWFGLFFWINLVKCYFFSTHRLTHCYYRWLSNVRPACKHPWYAQVMSHNLGGLVSDPHPPTLDPGGQELRLWSCLLSLSETWLQRGRSAWTISRTVTWNLDFLSFVQRFSIQHKESAIFYECLRSLRGCCFPPWWEVHTGVWHLYVWGRK